MTAAITSTLNLSAAAKLVWDAVVVGAGPAGVLGAHALTKAGRSVLLVDRAQFPRFKVCGCCLNGVALDTLKRSGLDTLPAFQRAAPITGFRGLTRGRSVDLQLPPGLAISRAEMDAALIEAAIRAGTTFVSGVTATLGTTGDQTRQITLRQNDEAYDVQARVVVAADGLSGRLLADQDAFQVTEQPAARIGGAAIVSEAPASYEPGMIYMICNAGGYAGLVRLPDASLNIAAAVSPQQLREAGGLSAFVAQLLTETDLPDIPEVSTARWYGSGRMTRTRSPLAAERVFVIGDAAGYVEPFTGEGMGIALASGYAVAPLVEAAIDDWKPDLIDTWTRRYRSLFARRRHLCRLLTLGLRSPLLTQLGSGLMSRFPKLASPYVRYINHVRH